MGDGRWPRGRGPKLLPALTSSHLGSLPASLWDYLEFECPELHPPAGIRGHFPLFAGCNKSSKRGINVGKRWLSILQTTRLPPELWRRSRLRRIHHSYAGDAPLHRPPPIVAGRVQDSPRLHRPPPRLTVRAKPTGRLAPWYGPPASTPTFSSSATGSPIHLARGRIIV